MASSSAPAIHIWYAFQSRNSEILPALQAAALLSDEETQRHGRFHFQEDRNLYLLSHAMLRLMLSRWAPVDPRNWQFSRSALGKPAIAYPAEFQSLQFNLSHTRGLAACVIGTHFAVGIDVECVTRRLEMLPVARRFFAPEEVEYLESRDEEERPHAFFEIWTLKEAYLKACGSGIFAGSLQDFSMELTAPGIAHIRFNQGIADSGSNWQFNRYRLESDYQMALAIQRHSHGELFPTVAEADLHQALQHPGQSSD